MRFRPTPLTPNRVPEPPRGYRPSQIAKSLGLSKSLVYAAIKQGDLPAVRIGKALIVLEVELQRWLDARRA